MMSLLQFCVFAVAGVFAVVGEFYLVLGCSMRCSLVWFVQYMVQSSCCSLVRSAEFAVVLCIHSNWCVCSEAYSGLLQLAKFFVVAVFLVQVSSIWCSCRSVWFVQHVITLLLSVCLVYLMHMALYCSWCLLLQLLASCCCLLLEFMQFLQFLCMFLLQLMQFITVAVVLCMRGQCCLISCCGSRCSLMWLLSEISVKRGAGTSPIQHLLFLTCSSKITQRGTRHVPSIVTAFGNMKQNRVINDILHIS